MTLRSRVICRISRISRLILTPPPTPCIAKRCPHKTPTQPAGHSPRVRARRGGERRGICTVAFVVSRAASRGGHGGHQLRARVEEEKNREKNREHGAHREPVSPEPRAKDPACDEVPVATTQAARRANGPGGSQGAGGGVSCRERLHPAIQAC